MKSELQRKLLGYIIESKSLSENVNSPYQISMLQSKILIGLKMQQKSNMPLFKLQYCQ